MRPVSAPNFLNVEKSALGKRWTSRLDSAAAQTALSMSQKLGIPDSVARVLAARGVMVDQAGLFLDPTLRALLPDPKSLTDMDKAASRLADAIVKKQRVTIFGDYDVDGAASSALVARYLGHYGLTSAIYIPDRIFEGYGPNADAVREIASGGSDLMVAVDCGTTSHDALQAAESLSLDVVVLDHHQAPDELPPAVALVNPNRADDLSGQGHLAAAGVVFLTLVATEAELGRRDARSPDTDLIQMVDLVGLATICDVVPLTGVNRAFVRKGLIAMRQRRNPGIAALANAARLSGPMDSQHLGFLIGPRINAGGRVGDAALGARLLTTRDPAEAEAIAGQLEICNQERKAIEKTVVTQALAEAEAEEAAGRGPSIVVAAGEGWHPGVLGLVASRLKDRLGRPAIAIGFNGTAPGAGSARSVSGFDIGAMMREAVRDGYLIKGGGHAMAAGLTIAKSKLGAFRAFLEKYAAEHGSALGVIADLKCDGAIAAGGVTVGLLDTLEAAGPFGAGNPRPVFALPSHRIEGAVPVGIDHIRVRLSGPDGSKAGAMAFRAADTPLGALLTKSVGKNLHLACTISANHWQGVRRPQISIIDAAAPE